MVWKVVYDGPCARCGTVLRAGTPAVWDNRVRRMYCVACPETAVLASPPPLSRGIPGASTRREHDRRLANDEARLADRYGQRVGGWIATARDERQSTRSFASGAYGEEKLAAALAKVPGIEVLHDRRIPGSKGNIDHIVVAPAGLFVIDTKRYRGRVELKRKGSFFHPEYRLYASGFDRTTDLDGVKALAAIVDRAVLDHEVAPQPIAVPVLCFVDAERINLGDRAHEGVLLETEHSIRELLLSDVEMAPGEVDHVARELGRLFPPK
jgi:hypothetical protein